MFLTLALAHGGRLRKNHSGSVLAGLLNLAPHGAKYGVGDRKLEVFNNLHVVGGNHHADLSQRLHLPSRKTREAGRVCTGLARKI
jgi:hypothetical protein